MNKVLQVLLVVACWSASHHVSAIEFSLIGLGPDWEGAENDAIDIRFDSTINDWRYSGDLGDTGVNYNVAAAYHRDSNQIYFIASENWAYGSGGAVTPDPAERKLYVSNVDFSQVQTVSANKLVSSSGSDLPQAMAFAGDQLYVIYRDRSIERVDRSTGASSAFATLPVTPKGVGMGYDDDQERLIVTVGGVDEPKTIYAVDTESGAVSALYSNINFYCVWQGLAYLGNAQLLAVGTGLDCTELTQIDLASGTVTALSLYRFDDGNGSVSNRYTSSQEAFPVVAATDLIALMRMSPWRPDPPTIQSATPADSSASIVFSAPARDGGSAITAYTLTDRDNGGTMACQALTCSVTGLTNGQTYRYTIFATNAVGDSAPSQEVTVTLPLLDADEDGVVDDADNCLNTANPDQSDLDLDGLGDLCDGDDDGDGVADGPDNCPLTANPDQSDLDVDGLGDLCDGDDDGDGVADGPDNCPLTANPDQSDLDVDGLGDLCDGDDDGDGVADGPDNCPLTANPDQSDLDVDGLGDLCDGDDDGDGVADGPDNCPLTANPDQSDLDVDGLGDLCDGDDDGDGVADGQDNCPEIANSDQGDLDGDGLGDVCDADDDGDGVNDEDDVFPNDPERWVLGVPTLNQLMMCLLALMMGAIGVGRIGWLTRMSIRS